MAQSPSAAGAQLGDAVSLAEADAIAPTSAAAPAGKFSVALSNFEGPFDLLLSLIGKHELDITEISLSQVTDEFISYLRGLDSDEELDQATEFLVVAATLLDLKVAGLLPQGELVDAEDVALLEARDLLFARLLQYRAFKQVSAWFVEKLETVIGRTVKFPDASVAGVPITDFAPEHPAAKAYRQMARELIVRGAVA